jgi:uncharacterized protein (TIGR02757 family)
MIAPARDSGAADLKARLESLRAAFGPAYRDADPVRFAHGFARPADREVAALIAAVLAFGKVEVVLRNLDGLFARLGPAPAEALAGADARAAAALARKFRHRWVGPRQLGALLLACGRLLRDHGSLEAAFAAGDAPASPTVEPGLASFADRALRATGRPGDRAMKFLFPSPARGGACKRLNLFLRWVVRPADGIDLGLWRSIAPARLLVPLDVHVAFHARVLGFSRRHQADWRMVGDVTGALRRLDPADPVRYDFALCHLGIHGDCRGRRDPMICPTCPIDALCRLPWRGRRR